MVPWSTQTERNWTGMESNLAHTPPSGGLIRSTTPYSMSGRYPGCVISSYSEPLMEEGVFLALETGALTYFDTLVGIKSTRA